MQERIFYFNSSPALKHVLQHGLMGQRQVGCSFQALNAEKQSGEQMIGLRREQRMAATRPGPASALTALDAAANRKQRK